MKKTYASISVLAALMVSPALADMGTYDSSSNIGSTTNNTGMNYSAFAGAGGSDANSVGSVSLEVDQYFEVIADADNDNYNDDANELGGSQTEADINFNGYSDIEGSMVGLGNLTGAIETSFSADVAGTASQSRDAVWVDDSANSMTNNLSSDAMSSANAAFTTDTSMNVIGGNADFVGSAAADSDINVDVNAETYGGEGPDAGYGPTGSIATAAGFTDAELSDTSTIDVASIGSGSTRVESDTSGLMGSSISKESASSWAAAGGALTGDGEYLASIAATIVGTDINSGTLAGTNGLGDSFVGAASVESDLNVLAEAGDSLFALAEDGGHTITEPGDELFYVEVDSEYDEDGSFITAATVGAGSAFGGVDGGGFFSGSTDVDASANFDCVSGTFATGCATDFEGTPGVGTYNTNNYFNDFFAAPPVP